MRITQKPRQVLTTGLGSVGFCGDTRQSCIDLGIRRVASRRKGCCPHPWARDVAITPPWQTGPPRNVSLFPYLNVEDLGTAPALLLIFHPCGHHLPGGSANVDFESMRSGLSSGSFQDGLMPRYIEFLTGQKTLKTYGEVLSLDEIRQKEASGLNRAIGIAPGEGLLVWEVQENLLRFSITLLVLLFTIYYRRSIYSRSTITS